ncbi:MAG: hypothetical protein NVS3B20_25560 [Polyangiales bacterium]
MSVLCAGLPFALFGSTRGDALTPSSSSPPSPPSTPSSPPNVPAAAPTASDPSPIPGNLDITADVVEVDTREQKATLSGKVVLTKGDLSLRCPRIEVRYDGAGPRVSWVKGTGGINADVKGVRGEAPEFELDLGKQRLVLRGGVRLYRGQGWVAADGAEFDLATARVTMSNVKASLPVSGALKKP